MKKTFLSLTTLLALAMVIVSPALAAANWTLHIHNNTEDDVVKITLTGPEDYAFSVGPGYFDKKVAEGDYKYSYTACGQKFSGDISVKDNNTWLIIDSCAAAPIYAKFRVDSHLGETLTLTLTGPQTYALTIDLGANVFLSLQTGWYTFSYDACGQTLTGEVRITKNGASRLTLYACEQLANHPQQTVEHVATNVRIASHYSFPVRVTLVGPNNYSFAVFTGMNRFNVLPGFYSYFYTAYGVTKSGSFNVGEAGAWITISPLK